ncbi:MULTISPECIES: hypothetical protein [Galbibacter]|uniref:Outer membrane lipoprotein-sorting protein n=1 Tax=Galbibacter pacificus TaxID=2996052 RepID=A0ABT6FVK1_9FLAO|nr:hypothetical protein [Galbibacter pacificus]MDG3583399.1 hypothetical protein [Galbibacter pacificus]MDG3587124.1 hypothetical protein [Galbibacter pacificus]
MRKLIYITCLFLGTFMLNAQEADSDLLVVKERLDSIIAFTADLELNVDVSFINMPTKYAKMHYKKGSPVNFESDDFVMVPKRGLDLSMQELFKNPFITVDRGKEEVNGTVLKKINIIPTNNKADFAIATLWIDTDVKRIEVSEINTKKNGTYKIFMNYNTSGAILPNKVIVSFEIEKIKLPIQYVAKNVEVDRKKMRKEATKTGNFILNISNYKIDKK